MNVFYFVKRFPRRFKTSNQQKIFSLAETFLNEGHKIHFVAADASNHKQYEFLNQYPINLVHVSSKKIGSSLSAAQVKPDLALFNNFQMEEMYSAYIYNKWNKCPRILQINSVHGLQKWRKSKYSIINPNLLIPYNEQLYQQKYIFDQGQRKSIIRSDFCFVPNDFIYYLVKLYTKQIEKTAILTHGYPIKQYRNEVKLEQHRPFANRKNFMFIADWTKQHAQLMASILIHKIWPEIKKQISDAELHIYGSNGSLKHTLSKTQLQKKGIFAKGYVEDLQILQKYKLLLYPAKFSVGLKSKIIESWLHHLPVITTPIGAEGMFHQLLEAKYAVSQHENFSGFINERQFTYEQKSGQQNLNSYYHSNSLGSNYLKNLSFGGSFLNYSVSQFANSAVEFYNRQQKWQNALKMGQKTILKNQSESQLQINLIQTLSKLELAMYKSRRNNLYQEQWKRFLQSKQYEKKIHEYF